MLSTGAMMTESIWVTNPSKESESRCELTWDLQDQVILVLPNGTTDTCSIAYDKPVFETFDERLYVRCKSRRLSAIDSISVEKLKIWQSAFFDSKQSESGKSDDEQIAKYARLLSEGLITLEDFTLLTAKSQPKTTAPPESVDPLWEEFVIAVDYGWPNVITRSTDALGRVTISGISKTVDRDYVSRLIMKDSRDFETAINSAAGLVNIAISFGQGVQITGLPTTFVGGFVQGAAGMPVLTKFFEKELRRGRRSEETQTLIRRYRDHLQSRQSKIRLFSAKMGWTDLNFM
jgi:hypothetical protein